MSIRFSLIDSIHPTTLTKHFERAADGSLTKTTVAHLTRGRVTPVELADLAAFGTYLTGLKQNQALMYGLPREGRTTDLVVQAMLETNPALDAIARTNEHFKWASSPGIFMLDYDPPKEGPSNGRDKLVERFFAAVPELKQTPLLWCPSASSHISEIGGADLTGLRGQRLYFAPADMSDAPRIGAQIMLRLWAADEGWYEISKSGALLKRALVDGAVWQPSRLDFAAGASVGEGLEQRRGQPKLILPEGWGQDGPLPFFDTRTLLPDAGPEIVERAKEKMRRAEEEKRPAAQARRRAFIRERLEQSAATQDQGTGHQETEASILKAIEDAVLGPDFVLHLNAPDMPDRLERVTVAKVLADPDRYDDRIACDPIEPDYNGWARTAKLYLRGKQARLHSLAHGGRTYKLIADRPAVTIVAGGLSKAVEQTLTLMNKSGLFMNLGDTLVTVASHRPTLLTEHSLAFRLGQIVRFQKIRMIRGVEVAEDIDTPDRLTRQIMHIGKAERSLPTLLGIARAPFLRPSGTLCIRPGFDAETGVYGHFVESDFPVIPETPTLAECIAAHDLIWSPFAELHLVSPASKTALLCAILTAPIRSVIDKSPFFASLAPDHGSGKTLVAEAIGALAIGARPAIMPPLDGSAEDEMRKRLTASLLPPADPVLILDNIEGYLSSTVLASFGTAVSWSDRILGQSRIELELPNRALVLITGKALAVKEELARRILPWTISPAGHGPDARAFSFCPVERMVDLRPQIITAVLTLIRAAHLAGPLSPLSTPSYAQWDALVRQTVLWINTTVAKGAYDDPLDLIRQATDHSSDRAETYELLQALHSRFKDAPFRASDIATEIQAGHIALQVQFDGVSNRRSSHLSARSIGRYLRNLADRPFHDLVLRSAIRANMCEWRVDHLAPRS